MQIATATMFDLLATATPSATPAAPTSAPNGSQENTASDTQPTDAAAAFAALLNAVLAPVALPEPTPTVADATGDSSMEAPENGTPDENGKGAAHANGHAHGRSADTLRFTLMTPGARAAVDMPAANATTLPSTPTALDDTAGPGNTASAKGKGRGLAALVAGEHPGLARGRARRAADDATGAADLTTPATQPTPTIPTEGVADVATATAATAAAATTTPNDANKPAEPTTQPLLATGALTGVDADLRAKLARVVERMRDEHGHDVDIVEGYRTQGRQDALYAQGRTTPGSVVTWTEHSQHTQGKAVDVSIDGGWNDRAAFAQLQQIAREEGLRTLGARDPGHLELARDDAGSAESVDAQFTPATPSAKPAPQRTNGMAQVAQVAQIASVAQVADVAVVATPGAAQPTAKTDTSAAGRQGIAPIGGRSGQSGRAHRDSDGADAQTGQDRRGAQAYAAAAQPQIAAPNEAPSFAAPAHIGGIAGADAVERVTRALEVREAGAPRAMSAMTLQIDNGMGGMDRIRVGLRGIEVGTSIDLASDAAAADRLRTSVGELRDALGRHGLSADTVQISSAARVMDAGETSRAMSAAASATRVDQTGGGNGSNASQQQSQGQSQQQRESATRDQMRDAQQDGGRRGRRDAQDDDTKQDARSRSRRGR